MVVSMNVNNKIISYISVIVGLTDLEVEVVNANLHSALHLLLSNVHA